MWQVLQHAVRTTLLLAEVDEEEHGKVVGSAEGLRGQGRHLGDLGEGGHVTNKMEEWHRKCELYFTYVSPNNEYLQIS